MSFLFNRFVAINVINKNVGLKRGANLIFNRRLLSSRNSGYSFIEGIWACLSHMK